MAWSKHNIRSFYDLLPIYDHSFNLFIPNQKICYFCLKTDTSTCIFYLMAYLFNHAAKHIRPYMGFVVI